MSTPKHYGLKHARNQLHHIASAANAGEPSVITQNGQPYAAVVPVQDLEKLKTARTAPRGLLALRGSGRGLWDSDGGNAVDALRDEWSAR